MYKAQRGTFGLTRSSAKMQSLKASSTRAAVARPALRVAAPRASVKVQASAQKVRIVFIIRD